MAILTRLGVPGTAEAWSDLAFGVTHDAFAVGRVLLRVDAVPSWSFDAVHTHPAPLGVPTTEHPPLEPTADAAAVHANGIGRIDHVVYAVPDLDEAVTSMTAVLGEPPRRRSRPRGASGPEMAFWRCGSGTFIEVVASGQPPSLWGIAFVSDDLDRTVAAIKDAGGPVGDPRPAVQGGRIASVWKGHVGWGVAIMEPPERQEQRHAEG